VNEDLSRDVDSATAAEEAEGKSGLKDHFAKVSPAAPVA
jgi:hypothetical protein